MAHDRRSRCRRPRPAARTAARASGSSLTFMRAPQRAALALVLASGLALLVLSRPARAAAPHTPKIADLEVTSDLELNDPGVLWSDDFDDTADLRDEYDDVNLDGGRFGLVSSGALGGAGQAVRQRYEPGQVSAGWMWRFFADHPHLATPGARRTEVYVRWYHRFAAGFAGVPPKMARLGGFARSDWTLSFMVHHWTQPSTLRLIADVASNIEPGGTAPVHTGYNQFVRWLPIAVSSFDFDDPLHIGRWICHELRVKLNTPFGSDGLYQMWADGQQILDVSGRNLVGGYVARGINAMQWDCYWNEGSPAAQSRFYDNVVIADRPIGPARSPVNPRLVKSAFSDPDPGDVQSGWQLQLASSPIGGDIVWDSGTIAGPDTDVRVSAATGVFGGSCSGLTSLRPSTRYWGRVRQRDAQNTWSGWSAWHAVLATEAVAIGVSDGGIEERRTPPGARLEVAASPNPFAASTTIVASSSRAVSGEHDVVGMAGRGEVRIVSARGAFVRRLALDAHGRARWDGRDGAGRPVASGVYLVHARRGGGEGTLRLVLLP